jgi:hypothetical protein
MGCLLPGFLGSIVPLGAARRHAFFALASWRRRSGDIRGYR